MSAAERGRPRSPELKVTERGRVLVLTMDRPQARNAMSLQMAQEIADALDLLDSRPDLSVGVITGANDTFCAGMDLKGFARGERPVVEGRGFAGLVQSAADQAADRRRRGLRPGGRVRDRPLLRPGRRVARRPSSACPRSSAA